MGNHRGEVPETRACQDERARGEDGGRRWLRRVWMGRWVGGMRRIRRPVGSLAGSYDVVVYRGEGLAVCRRVCRTTAGVNNGVFKRESRPHFSDLQSQGRQTRV